MYEVTFNDKTVKVNTSVSLFSPDGADKGTLSMLKHVDFSEEDVLCDLGCGAGIVSLAACCFGVKPSNIVMTDVDFEATRIASENMKINGFDGFTAVTGDAFTAVKQSGFTLILSNPPYHTDFKVAKSFIEKGFNRLSLGGKMYMVTKRKDWYKNKLISIFGGVKVFEEDGGYFVFEAEKRKDTYAGTKPKKKGK